MLVYVSFDDTDVAGAPMGTGRLTRLFASGLSEPGALPCACEVRGILRHQLPRLEDIPFTSNNSSACLVLETEGDDGLIDRLIELGTAHLAEYAVDGSDPGLCVLTADEVPGDLVEFGVRATSEKKTQTEAMRRVPTGRLYGLGGTNDGIIGAAAAIGLTRYGWCGRFIEYGGLRSLGDSLTVADLESCGIRVMSTDRDPAVPLPGDRLEEGAWVRPSLMAGSPVLQVRSAGPGLWATAHTKRKKAKKS